MATQTVVAETQEQPLGLFKRLGSRVLYYEPPTTNGVKSQVTHNGTPEPDLIILLSWLDARPRHIAKYTNTHMKLYPTAKILLVTTTELDFTFTLESTRRRQCEPALPVIRALHDSSTSPRILVHCFSNGGGKRLFGLGALYRQRHPTHAHLPITAYVYDSGPTWPWFWRSVHVFMQPAPKNIILRALYAVWVYTFSLGLITIVHYTPFFKNVAYNAMHGLNDPEVITTKAPRSYIYSKEDEACDYRDVDNHAAEAEKNGYQVTKYLLKGSKHVQHAVVHGQAYWDLVEKAWAWGVKENDAY